MAMTISEQNYINAAINRARGAYNNAIATARRNAERMGVNPNSGAFSAIENSANFTIAASTATAGNEASANWLKQAQEQSQFDDKMKYQYSALEAEKELTGDKLDFEYDKLLSTAEAAEGYLDEKKREERANSRFIGTVGSAAMKFAATSPYNTKKAK